MQSRKETELYAPVKKFFTNNGYTVKGEVNGCDLVAVKGEELVIVELKTRLNLDLFLQGTKRQTVTRLVYLAVEKPKRCTLSHRRDILRLCRRLGLGLLTVSFFAGCPHMVEVWCEPKLNLPASDHRKRRSLQQEFAARTGDFNEGGSCRRPLVTAYRQQALLVAAKLHSSGPCSPKQIMTALNLPKAGAILQKNYYHWFHRLKRGLYGLSRQGEEALKDYAGIIHHWKEDSV
ncbi:MAG TPA: hypothetical protein GX391_06975 [Firmicutes bacterium]|jgi:hypothetical protein|nr:hypothetical protein [Bacillota bacterium]HOQ24628.1 DUF2161 family putative PD-(D/E)XK-type phosphodiesterase [Bacillota bacterium]HPT67973.1 DUF2161 family putative PD-(D/E)XK-type phosphodiesterase [Bacillota bacterium]